jgi:hypothetical protein
MQQATPPQNQTAEQELTQYCNCMEEVRQRVTLVHSILTRSVSTGYPAFDLETTFLQLRKILEVIAFASLTANKDVYSAAYATFATHWNAADTGTPVG